MLITMLACPNCFMLEIESALLLCALVYIITEQARCIRANFAALANSALRRVSDCDQEIRKCPRSSCSMSFVLVLRQIERARRLYEMSMCVRRVSNLFFIRIVDFYDVGKYWRKPARLKTQLRDNRKIRQDSSHAATFYLLPYRLTFLQSPTLRI